MIASLPTLAEPRHFSSGRRLLFVALVAASVYGFWRRFGPILHKILASKKDADFSPLPHRQARARLRLGGDAPGQGHPRAAARRPGSCIGLLGLLRLCAGHAEPLRDDFRARLSRSRRARWGDSTFISRPCSPLPARSASLGLFVRRFFVRPKWLGELSWESGLIALPDLCC